MALARQCLENESGDLDRTKDRYRHLINSHWDVYQEAVLDYIATAHVNHLAVEQRARLRAKAASATGPNDPGASFFGHLVEEYYSNWLIEGVRLKDATWDLLRSVREKRQKTISTWKVDIYWYDEILAHERPGAKCVGDVLDEKALEALRQKVQAAR